MGFAAMYRRFLITIDKCYLNEELCIITSLNLYEFSQINNNEMGVLLRRSDDAELYKDAYEEAQRIIRISDEVRISLERVISNEESKPKLKESSGKITSSKLAQKLGIKTNEFFEKLIVNEFTCTCVQSQTGDENTGDRPIDAGYESMRSALVLKSRLYQTLND